MYISQKDAIVKKGHALVMKILRSCVAILLNLRQWRKTQNLTGYDWQEGVEETRIKVRLSVMEIFLRQLCPVNKRTCLVGIFELNGVF